jgi:hypothetical protein
MVRDRFLVTPLACGWQVIHQSKTHGRYATHCEAALAAMLLAQMASEVGIYAEVVIEAGNGTQRGWPIPTHPRAEASLAAQIVVVDPAGR